MEQDKINSIISNRLADLEINKAEQEVKLKNLQDDRDDLRTELENLQEDIEPLKQHMIVSSALIKAVSVLGALIGVILGIVQIISKVR